MVDEQLQGERRDISDESVLRAMSKIPRHEFVPADLKTRAYDDCALPIGYGQTISQPYIVAFMSQQLGLRPTDRVLEIGTGSAYQTAILAELAAEVYSIEIVPELADRATAVLKRLGSGNVHLRLGDGYHGWPQAAPFDAILVTCAPEGIPQPLIDQLADGGRLVIPAGRAGKQSVFVLRRRGNKLDRETLLPVQFVPMTGDAQNGSAAFQPA